MTLIDDVHRLQEKCKTLEDEADKREKRLSRLEEQVIGERGISATLNSQTREIASLRKAAYWVAGVIVVGAITFAFAALQLSAGGL
ncbi:MAG TPA: hypothetical protein VFT13_03695 [Candidatus Krumholzibacteria bacterium]|nr:hypothetical protein [Candidatus Krumholzibacteria bacterium]